MAPEARRTISRRVRLVGEDGRTVAEMPEGGIVEVLDEAAWVRVRTDFGDEGFVARTMIDAEVTSTPTGPRTAPADVESASGMIHPTSGAGAGVRRYPTEGTRFIGAHVLEAHVDFHPLLAELNEIADTVGVDIYATHTFRRAGQSLDGTVVTPATRSNHLVGHAIDMNLVFERELLDSKRLHPSRHAELPGAARLFLSGVRSHPRLRWGGDFLRPDPVHVDDDLSRRDPAEWSRKFTAVQV